MRGAWALQLVLGAIATIIILVVSGPPARATFPGENGRIAYDKPDFTANPQSRAIFLVGSGQLTFPPPGIRDSDAAWSPDGEELAFTEYDVSLDDSAIVIIGKDGTGRRQLIGSDAFDESASIHAPAWSNDGQRLAFSVRTLDSTRTFDNGIWTVAADGSGLTQVVQEYHSGEILNKYADWPSWSPVRNEIAYVCWFRTDVHFNLRPDICIVNLNSRARRTVPIDGPPGTTGGGIVFGGGNNGPKWSPDGEKLVFNVRYQVVQLGPNGGPISAVTHSEIFTVNRDGTGLTQITNSPVDEVCPPAEVTAARWTFGSPSYSPDGAWIVTVGSQNVYKVLASGHCVLQSDGGLWMMSSMGGSASLLVPNGHPFPNNPSTEPVFSPDWQPILGNLTVAIADGHSNPLKGLKVELRTLDGTVVDAQPINTVGGTYVFENAVAPGEYVLRATLVDNAGSPGSPPAFEIRYKEIASEPVWIEQRFTQADSTYLSMRFEESPDISDSNVGSLSRDRLDDMANIYFRVRQFVDWVKTHLTADTGQTVEFYTFATADPWGGTTDPSTAGAYYNRTNTAVVMDPSESDYENRDGFNEFEYDDNSELIAEHTDDAPENSEWHEFTHHLFDTFVNNGAACNPNYTNHGGYNNPDTCDSMSEGFAVFLPTLAAQDIEGATDADYDNMGYNLDDVKYKAWGYREDLEEVFEATIEDIAVAGLFWDLVDVNADIQLTYVIGADRLHHPADYHDQVFMPIRQLWNQLTSFHPATVFDLRISFGHPALTIDLDGDGIKDVAPIDEVFLMHGFFPIDRDQTITDSHKTYHYNVAYAPGTPNNSVGTSSHKVYDASGTVTASLIPRYNTPPQPHANLELHVLDASGNPLSGATVNLTIQYPGGREHTISRQLGSGGGLVHLELPPYFDYLLPSGASLPDCDPAHDFHVQVTLSAMVNGTLSSESPSFDNCTYQHVMAAATGPAALSFTLTVPVTTGGTPDSTPPIITSTQDPPPNANGWNNSDVTVIFTATDETSQATCAPAQVVLSNEGAGQVVSTTCTDAAGNSATATHTVNIDKTPPTLAFGSATPVPNAAGWNNTDVSVPFMTLDNLSGVASTNPAASPLVLTTEGAAVAGAVTVTDLAGNSATFISPAYRIDKSPPSISISGVTNGATYTLGCVPVAGFEATDALSGMDISNGGLTGGNVNGVGSFTYTATATDQAGNTTTIGNSYTVVYTYLGFLQPINSNGSSVFKLGSTVPIKFQLTDCNGNAVTTAVGTLGVFKITDAVLGTTEVVSVDSSGSANTDNLFRYSDPNYIYNLSTKPYSQGTYRLQAALDDGTVHTVNISLQTN